jgi:hypothetical protein
MQQEFDMPAGYFAPGNLRQSLERDVTDLVVDSRNIHNTLDEIQSTVDRIERRFP